MEGSAAIAGQAIATGLSRAAGAGGKTGASIVGCGGGRAAALSGRIAETAGAEGSAAERR